MCPLYWRHVLVRLRIVAAVLVVDAADGGVAGHHHDADDLLLVTGDGVRVDRDRDHHGDEDVQALDLPDNLYLNSHLQPTFT